MKVEKLTGAQLDYCVALADGMTTFAGTLTTREGETLCDIVDYSPSNDWAQGGPIIEREKISVVPPESVGDFDCWRAFLYGSVDAVVGATPLIAAMRAFVTSKYGDSVPDG